jgi:hypothetical protein
MNEGAGHVCHSAPLGAEVVLVIFRRLGNALQSPPEMGSPASNHFYAVDSFNEQ